MTTSALIVFSVLFALVLGFSAGRLYETKGVEKNEQH